MSKVTSIEPIPVNLPFERIPEHGTDPGLIWIEPRGYSKRGMRYRTRRGGPDGAVLCEHTLSPVLDSCRALAAQGVAGPFRTHKPGIADACMRGDIERAAKLEVATAQDGPPRFRKHRPRHG